MFFFACITLQLEVHINTCCNARKKLFLFLRCVVLQHASKSFYMHFRLQRDASKKDVRTGLYTIVFHALVLSTGANQWLCKYNQNTHTVIKSDCDVQFHMYMYCTCTVTVHALCICVFRLLLAYNHSDWVCYTKSKQLF